MGLGCPWRDYSPGLLADGTDVATMVTAPLARPEAPIPATALATINIFEELAAPHRRDPNSKSARNVRKVYWGILATYGNGLVLRLTLELKYVYSLPVGGCSEQLFSLFNSVQLDMVRKAGEKHTWPRDKRCRTTPHQVTNGSRW